MNVLVATSPVLAAGTKRSGGGVHAYGMPRLGVCSSMLSDLTFTELARKASVFGVNAQWSRDELKHSYRTGHYAAS